MMLTNNILFLVSAVLPSLVSSIWWPPWKPRPRPRFTACAGKPVQYTQEVLDILGTTTYSINPGLDQYRTDGLGIGSTTALIAEASDAATTGVAIVDGQSGNINFPHGNLKPIATIGERSVCDGTRDEKFTGVPDGVGAYLITDSTLRVVVQSESYGPLLGPNQQSFPFKVNGNVYVTGSHVQYIDYDRESMVSFMSSTKPASAMVTGFGSMIETIYNLKGDLLGKRNMTGPSVAPMYSNTNKDGVWAIAAAITNEADWFYQSFCSAHLEQKHQWGTNIGLEDDIWMTNEEWQSYKAGFFVGLSAHVIDMKNKAIYATGVFTNGGFEKIYEINSQNPNYVMFGVSGYNGDFGDNNAMTLAARITSFGVKPDGNPYVWPENIHPYRIYVGVKGKREDGSAAPATDFLARNGLKYGQLYGFAVNMTVGGPTQGLYRDAFHFNNSFSTNGKLVPGKWIKQPWRWNGTVTNFEFDGSWDYQLATGVTDYTWWNAGGLNRTGCKCEHGSPDPRPGVTGFVQGSTCGYFGHLYVDGVAAALTTAGGGFPAEFEGRYYVYQGERDVVSQIELGGAGVLAGGRDLKKNWDNQGYGSTGAGTGKVTFEDIDGLELLMDKTGKLYAVIQEDSTSFLGDRMFITKLEHADDGQELKYYYVAMSGGQFNSRVAANAGVPRGTGKFPSAHEFSGVFDLSGLLYKEAGKFYMNATSTGKMKRDADAKVGINDKQIIINLQAHSMAGGIVEGYRTDRGGQIYMYKPNLPAAYVA